MTDIIFIINKLFYESKINIELWSDVETVIELLVTNHVESLIQRSHGLLDKKVAKQLLKAQTADTVINYNYSKLCEGYDKGKGGTLSKFSFIN